MSVGRPPSASLPHHDGSALYVGDPAPTVGDQVEVRVRVPHAGAAEHVHVRTVVEGEPHYVAAEPVAEDATETWWAAKVPVHHQRTPYRFLLHGGRAGYRWLNAAGVFDHDVPDREDFAVTSDPSPPTWLADAVVYQVFPDRFARGGCERKPLPEWAVAAEWDQPVADDWRISTQQVYGGDLLGLLSRLDHLERLGVNVVYLTPFFPAQSAHRYDATSFERVDPLLGGNAALAQLTAEAHRRGIRVIGDLTTNHSGREHRWFSVARADAAAPESRFYSFRDHPDDYVAWFDVPSLPKFDHRAPELRDRLISGHDSVVRRWLRPPYSLDGWRIDVANMTGRLGTVDVNHDVARALRSAMAAERHDLWLLAEHCHDATADLVGDGWHGTMAYTWFTRPVWSWLRGPSPISFLGVPHEVPRLSGPQVVASMRWLAAGVPWRSFVSSMTLLDSHDSARFASVTQDRRAHIVGVAWLLTYPGVPMVFAGDEIGMVGVDGDRARAPFPWDEAQWDQDLLATFETLIRLRRRSDALRNGGLRIIDASHDSITFLRESAVERMLVHLTRASGGPARLDARGLGIRADDVERVFGTADLIIDERTLSLPGYGPAANIWRIGP